MTVGPSSLHRNLHRNSYCILIMKRSHVLFHQSPSIASSYRPIARDPAERMDPRVLPHNPTRQRRHEVAQP